MTTPSGNFDATIPGGTPAAGKVELDETNLNSLYLQLGTTSELNAIVDKLGMIGYDTSARVIRRNDGTTMIPLQLLKVGIDGNKPTADAANNGQIYLATNTNKLYFVIDATRHEVSFGTVIMDATESNKGIVELATLTEITGANPSATKVVTGFRLKEAVAALGVNFDLHDDVTLELTAPSSTDRLLTSDESAAGDPNKYLTMLNLFQYISTELGVFDVHDDVSTETTTLVDSDRFVVSKENVNGDPNRYITTDSLVDDLFGKKITVSDVAPTANQLSSMAEGDFWAEY